MSTIEQTSGLIQPVIDSALARLVELGLHATWEPDGDEGQHLTGIICIGHGNTRLSLPAVATASVTPGTLALLPHDDRTVLVADHVSPARARSLRDRGWGGFVDAAGNASLRGHQLVIEVTGRTRTRPARRTAPRAPFSRAGLPVTLALLTTADAELPATQRTLAAISGASIGTVNRVTAALRERRPPMLDASTSTVLRAAALEEEWVSAYSALQPEAWPEERFSSDVWSSPATAMAADLPPTAVLGSEAAAARLGAPIRPESVLFHLDADSPSTRTELIRRGRLRPAEDGMVRLRTAPWANLPAPLRNGVAPRILLRADLLLEDDPRLDEISTQHFGRRG